MSRDVIAIVDDLFFASKIRGATEQFGARVIFPKTIDLAIDEAKKRQAVLMLVNLQAQGCDAIELARRVRLDEDLGSIELIGFFSHVNADLQRQATAAGFDRAVPNSLLIETLVEILRR